MSEEIKKEAQDTELNKEELDKVAGGKITIGPNGEYLFRCPECGETYVPGQSHQCSYYV